MGSTFYLLTATFFAAQAPETIPVNPKHVPVATIEDSCDCCSATPSFWDRLKSLKPHFGNDCGCGGEERPRLWTRIHDKFSSMLHRHDCAECASCSASQMSPADAPTMPTPIQKMPKGQKAISISEVSYAPEVIHPVKKTRLLETFLAKINILPIRAQETIPTSTIVYRAVSPEPIWANAKTVPVRAVQAPPANPNYLPAIVKPNITPIQYQSAVGGNQPASKTNPIRPALRQKVGHEANYRWITGQLQRVGGRWVLYYASPETIDRFGGRLILASDLDLSLFHDGDLVSVQGVVLTSAQGNQPSRYLANSVHLLER